jgi:uncharacterized membrane protein
MPLSTGPQTPGAQDPAAADHPAQHDFAIQDVSAWVLRIGVISSTAVMILGVIVTYLHHPPSVHHMTHYKFTENVGHIWRGVLALHGGCIIDVGIFMLVLTPIVRVFTSMLLFAFEEHDYFYAVVTLLVFIMTLGSLLFIK